MPEQTRQAPAQERDKVLLPSAALAPDQIFRLLTGSVVPRPIAWTSTISRNGVPNLAPFSFFTVVSNQPPMVSLTIETRTDGRHKDTYRNIRETGEFVVNIASTGSVQKVYESSHEVEPDVNEFCSSATAPAPSRRVMAPSVDESLIQLECLLHDVVWPGSDALVIGEVVAFRADPSVLAADGRVDLVRLDPLARVASQFAHVGAPFFPSIGSGAPSH